MLGALSPSLAGLGSMNILVFITTTIGIGILISIPGILIGRFLVAKGIVRDRSVSVVVISVLVLLSIPLIAPDFPMIYIATVLLFFSPLGAYRDDLWTTFRSGKWWWLKKNDEMQPLFDLPVSLILSLVIWGVVVALTVGALILIANLLP